MALEPTMDVLPISVSVAEGDSNSTSIHAMKVDLRVGAGSIAERGRLCEASLTGGQLDRHTSCLAELLAHALFVDQIGRTNCEDSRAARKLFEAIYP